MQTLVVEVKDASKSYAVIEVIERVPRFHSGWESVTYKGQRFQVFGGIRTTQFINVAHPIKGR